MGERKRLQPELRRRQILQAAVRLFYEAGFEGASLRDLSAQVGINKATIYHYFESKEDILFELVHRIGQELLEGVREAFERGGEPVQVLESMIRFQIGYVENHVEEVKVLVEEKKSLRADLQQTSLDTEGEILRLYKEAILQCQAAGAVRSLHATTAAFGILGQINWLYHWYKPEGPLSLRELADAVVSLLFHGLLPCADGGAAS